MGPSPPARDSPSPLAPEMDWREAKVKLWRSVDAFGAEGSPEKEEAIRTQILG